MIGRIALVSFSALAGLVAAKSTSAGIAEFAQIERRSIIAPAEAPALIPTEPRIFSAYPIAASASDATEFSASAPLELEIVDEQGLVPVPASKPGLSTSGLAKPMGTTPRATGKAIRSEPEKVRLASTRTLKISDFMLPIVGAYR